MTVVALPGGNPNHHLNQTEQPKFVDLEGRVWNKYQVTFYDVTIDKYMAIDIWAMNEEHLKHCLSCLSSGPRVIELVEGE